MSASSKPDIDSEKHGGDSAPSVVLQEDAKEIDLATFHELHAGRLVIDPAEAKIEFGETFASRLKLSRDGTKVLWPQPTDSARDPQNWSNTRKSIHLFIVTLAAIVPDFDSGIGIASLFPLAQQFNTTTGVINNLTSNWSIFLLGWGGIFAVMVIRRYGRLPILFWSQVLALGFLVGCTFAPNLKTFTGMRCLTAFFATAPQVAGLYIVTDLYPFHLQARKLNIWTMGFIISPFLSPFAFGFLVARQTWRWAYGIGCMYSAVVCILIALFMNETMYDRTVKPIPEPPTTGLRYRIETLVGITGIKMAKYRVSWTESILSPINVVWRPHLLGALLFEGMLFGFSIGLNVTNVVFLGTPLPIGFGWSQDAIAGAYGTPIVSVLLGELVGRYLNDWIMNKSIKRNSGVFEAESRLWACYIALPLYICGFVTFGASIQKHLNTAGIVMGWGIAELATMINTVAIYAYCNDCFPKHQGEISALINLARTLGGFAVAYFQVPWAEKHGAIQTFGCEAAIVAGIFLLIVPALQIYGRSLRKRFSMA
ncbi:related to synaptic vesicle transporter SVOP and related transporters (major facilitator superfamily) [Armillaria ostoyae]|uniref:Related to synaptic vesicle transporter SVOP and related transporters (Major facilitator superfamily) n=1 Tax=Armillaria ostoyae TaxID=47428 RepID=A0A284QQ41_ARMOS|nr:related to synaptic vesicle transporter SVOP and related transporters (major facilitator superfamily) [Armillaria ostoyae]